MLYCYALKIDGDVGELSELAWVFYSVFILNRHELSHSLKIRTFFFFSKRCGINPSKHSRDHLVVQDPQRLVGGEVLQFGLEDDEVSSPASLDHLLPVLVVEAALVLDQAADAQVLAHVPAHRTLAEVRALWRQGRNHVTELRSPNVP